MERWNQRISIYNTSPPAFALFQSKSVSNAQHSSPGLSLTLFQHSSTLFPLP